MAARVTFQGIEEYALPDTGVARVTFQGIEEYATPPHGVARITFVAIEMCVDLNPGRPRRFGIAV